ncbi:hypothetical protein [Burkholderia pseudomallei]|uniref:hypothetical protein n=2 Tax=Burkholderia pseudomallei TaxID=28450 RepID=UPI00016B1542|nr:hypothetical protein [Burkholderia pseudomallei]EXI97952.1 hypothetical protein T210_0136050 [Burkholderia pseudomallei MSHR6137]NRE32111.1 hypothetical protein [Burkholderia pseudomallei]QCU31293.1 hypothetical protein FE789_25640 [Burkholderia pseudomallei]
MPCLRGRGRHIGMFRTRAHVPMRACADASLRAGAKRMRRACLVARRAGLTEPGVCRHPPATTRRARARHS